MPAAAIDEADPLAQFSDPLTQFSSPTGTAMEPSPTPVGDDPLAGFVTKTPTSESEKALAETPVVPPEVQDIIGQSKAQQKIEQGASITSVVDAATKLDEGLTTFRDNVKEVSDYFVPGFFEQATTSPLHAEPLKESDVTLAWNMPAPESMTNAAKAIRNSVNGFVEGAVTPAMFATVLGGELIGGAKLVQGGFVAYISTQFPALWQRVKEAEKTPAGSQERWEAGLGMSSTLALVHGLGRGATKREPSTTIRDTGPPKVEVPLENLKIEEGPAVDAEGNPIPPITIAPIPEPGTPAARANELLRERAAETPPEEVQPTVTAEEEIAAADSKLRPGDKADTGDLFMGAEQGTDQPFNLAGETGPDNAAIQVAKEERAAQAAELDRLRVEHEQELWTDFEEHQKAGGDELLDALKAGGGLPTKSSPRAGIFEGELQNIRDEILTETGQRTTGGKYNQIFSKDAPDLDVIAQHLKNSGFDVDTPNDVVNLMRERLRSGNPIYGDEAKGLENQGFHLRERAGESGYTDLIPDLVDFGARVYQKGMDFAKWSWEMVRHFGGKVVEVLKTVWDSMTGRNILPHARESGGIGGAPTEPTGVKNVKTEAQRVRQGIEERTAPIRATFPGEWEAAMKVVEANPRAGSQLVDELGKRPRAMTPQEVAIMSHEVAVRENTFNRAVREVNEAKTPEDAAAARQRLAAARDDNHALYNATAESGTPAGQALAFRKMLVNPDDFTLAKMESEARAIENDGKPFDENDPRLKEIHKQYEEIADLKKKLSASESKNMDAEAESYIEQLAKETKRDAREAVKRGSSYTSFIEDQMAKAKARIIARRGTLKVTIDPLNVAGLVDEAIIGAGHIAKGIIKFPEWSEKMLSDFGERIRPFLKDLFDRAKQYQEAHAKLFEKPAGKTPKEKAGEGQ